MVLERAKKIIAAIILAYTLVTGLALVAKWLIEGFTNIVYEIHWVETMPILALVFAYGLLRAWYFPQPKTAGKNG